MDAAQIGNISADNITAGTLSVDRIAAGSITGGTGGKIANSTITQSNTVSQVQNGITGGLSYNTATSSRNPSDYPPYFKTGYLTVTSAISMYDPNAGANAAFTPKKATINGTTIHYLGW